MAVSGEKDAQEVRALVRSIEQLRKSYDRYFAGLDKIEPQAERKRVQRELDRLSRLPITNTQVRFQLAQAKGRLITLQGHWNSVMLQMERGTYRRDRYRADLRDKLRDDTTDVPQAPAGAPKRKPAGDEALPGELVDKLHRAYLYAKKKCNEPTDGISRDRLQASLAKQVERMQSQSPGSRPEFKVVIKDGKARIVARKGE